MTQLERAEAAIEYFERTFSKKSLPFVSDKFRYSVFGGIRDEMLQELVADFKRTELVVVSHSDANAATELLRRFTARSTTYSAMIERLNKMLKISVADSKRMILNALAEPWIEQRDDYNRKLREAAMAVEWNERQARQKEAESLYAVQQERFKNRN